MRSAPAPDLLPIPGMNQGTAVAGGSGGSGDGDGTAGDGNDKEGAGGGGGGNDASGDNRNAPDYKKYPTCGTESHPVDVVTGRVFTHPIVDLELPGPLPFSFERSYSSAACKETQGLGWGWGHSLGWFIEVERRRVRVWNEKGVSVSFEVPQIGHSVLGDWGWVLRRELWGFAVDANDEVWRIFSTSFDEGKTFRLTAIEDRNKNRIGLTYDDGKLVEVKDSAGRIIKVTSTPGGQITTLQVKNAEHQGQWIRFARYEYDDKGRLVRVTDADDYSWKYEYDEHNRLVRDTDRIGLSFCFRYDNKDRGIEAWGEYVGKRDPSLADDLPKFLADGRTRAKGIYHRKLDYHKDGYTEVTDTTETRRYFGNKKGLLDKAVMGGAVTTSKYDARGFQIEQTDEIGATWQWVRDERGRVVEQVDPLGRITTVERDAYGLPVRHVDPTGAITTAHRDERGNAEFLQDAAGGATQLTYEPRGLAISATVVNGATTRYTYDAQGNLVEVVQPNGGVWRFVYNAFGRPLSIIDPSGAESRFTYTNRGDIAAMYDALGGVTRYSYDGEAHLTQLVTPAGHTTQLVWGGFHKLCSRRNADGHAVRLAYSRDGQLLAVYNERDEVHRLFYKADGSLVAEQTYDGRMVRYRNDAAERPVLVENGAGEITALVYDLAGQLVARELPDGTAESYEYDKAGRLTCATNAVGEFLFQRDVLGRIVREAQTVAGENSWIEVGYDTSGNRVRRTTSLGHTERMERDSMGARVRTWLDEEQRLEHKTDLMSREVARQLPGGGTIESAFDPLGRLARRIARSQVGSRGVVPDAPEWIGRHDDGVTAVTSFAYEADGHIVSKLDLARGVIRYGYDPIGQVLSAIPEKARPEVFRYDAAGNVHEAAEGTPERVYGPGNQILRKGNTTYTWDGDGRLSEKSEQNGARVWKYAWNGAGLLEVVETPDGRSIQFAYDPFARRMAKTVRERNGETIEETRFVWDGDVLVHEVRAKLHAAGDPIVEEKTYSYEDGEFAPFADRRTDRSWHYHLTDHLGTPSGMVAATGALESSVDQSTWGYRSNEQTTPTAFPGQYFDADTGLAYNRCRYYDPDVGHFVSQDPLLLGGGLNTYGYALSPTDEADPYGLITPSNISGFAGEAALKRLYPGGNPKTIPMQGDNANRNVDNFTPDPTGATGGTAREAKAGKICLSKRVKDELRRDQLLMKRKPPVKVEWHFFKSPINDGIGPSKGLQEALDKAGIPVVPHPQSKTK